jgi:acetyl-CoA synthetase
MDVVVAKMNDSWKRFVEAVQRGERPPFAEHWSAFRSAYADGVLPFAWEPDDAVRARSHLYQLQRELGLEDYRAVHRYSVDEKEAFWARALERLRIVFDEKPRGILDLAGGVTSPRWLPGAKLDITRSCFTAPASSDAVVFGRENGAFETLSYERLEREVDRFAGGLLARGLRTGDGVALYMPMTPECVIAYLGTVRAGCRVVSVADSFSAEELHGRIDIVGARAIVTVSSYRRGEREIALYKKVRDAVAMFAEPPTVIVVDARELETGDVGWDDFLEAAGPESRFAADPYHVTNVLFSSGTTGAPKAIPWTELTPIKAAMDAHFHHDVHASDVVCWPTNIGWMMGPWLVYASLVNGATMALYEGVPTGAGFGGFVRDAGVTVLGVVPSMVRAWRAAASIEAGAWPDVRVLTSTGEASSGEDYLWLMSRADYRAPVIEYLGGTEIGGGHLTATVLQPAAPATFTTPALGIDVVVLDDEGEPVAEGDVGEMFLVPPALGLSQELLNRDHDAEYYDGCPSGPRGEVLRRHGDQIARLRDGYFKAHGRADDTMNLGGIKVSSIELERVVNEHPRVHESAAIAVQRGGEGADRLVVYVVLRDGEADDALAKDLGKQIARRLNPLFKIDDVVAVPSLPRTASNKIMRRELRAAYTAGLDA